MTDDLAIFITKASDRGYKVEANARTSAHAFDIDSSDITLISNT